MTISYKVKSYHRKNGSKVRSHIVREPGLGLSRGRITGGRYSLKKGFNPWITKKNKLGGKGFLKRPRHEQMSLLDKCVLDYGYKSCLGSIMVLNRNKAIRKHYGPVIDSIKKEFMAKHRVF